jgi:phage head maturation protease
MATYKITQDDRCPITRPYGVVDDGGELESCHPSRVEAQAAITKLNAAGDEPESPGMPTDMPMHRASNTPWSQFSASDYTPEQYKAACLIDKGTGDPNSKDRYALPVKEPSGALNRNGVHAAAGRLNQVQGISPDKRAAAARALIRFYGQLNEEPPDHLRQMAGMTSSAEGHLVTPMGDVSQRAAPTPIEERAARLANVDFGERILTLVAVPYEQPTPVEYRGEVWREVFSRTAFNGFDPTRHRRIPVSAVLRAPAFDHNDGHLVGKVTSVYPERTEGLVLDVRISSTPAGDETLQLAHDDALSPSVGFVARGGDHVLERRTMTRRINRAFLDHLSMVPTPAYEGARVLGMRDQGPPISARDLPRLHTPELDDYLSDPLTQWASDRLTQMGGW